VVGARPRSPSGTCWKATLGGARLLGWDDQIGSIEPCKQADLAVWRLSGLAHADIVDPVAALVLGDRASARLAVGGGSAGVRADRLLTADEDELTADALGTHRKLAGA
jgi:8-oxoguanine deaminase